MIAAKTVALDRGFGIFIPVMNKATVLLMDKNFLIPRYVAFPLRSMNSPS